MSTYQKVLNGEVVLFGLLTQSGVAKQCLLHDQLTNSPLCGEEASNALYDTYDLAGIRGFGTVRTQEAEDGRSLMLRWNGTMWQDVASPKTLSRDLSGGQAFFATNTSKRRLYSAVKRASYLSSNFFRSTS